MLIESLLGFTETKKQPVYARACRELLFLNCRLHLLLVSPLNDDKQIGIQHE